MKIKAAVLCILLMSMSLAISKEEATMFSKIPKAELHIHLGGSYPIEYLETIATEEEIASIKNELLKFTGKMDYHTGFSVFPKIAKLVDTNKKVKAGVIALCDKFYEDGVTHLELRTGLKCLDTSEEGYLKAVLEGMAVSRKKDFKATLLISVKRRSKKEFVEKSIDLALKYINSGVVGVDVSDDSTVGDIDCILDELIRAKKSGLKLALHIGESPKETNQRQLLEALNPDRLGHGVFLEESAKDWMLENKVPLEVCLTSGHIVEMVNEIKEHPGFLYYRMGHPIVICSDDPLVFSTTLSKEYEKALLNSSLTEEDLLKLARDSHKYAF
ncbi:MAG: Cyclic adenylate deaminase [Chlamydiia bacterium]|nr:Cyclic adenylate deaminase [Chlamydiia bacterium]